MSSGGRDVVSGAVLLVASLGLLWVIPDQVETLNGPNLTPAFVPTVMAIAIAVLSVILLFQGVCAVRNGASAAEERPQTRRRRSAANVAAVIFIIAVQTALLTRLGYLLATGAAIIALAVLYGHRRWWQVLVLALIAPPAIMLSFRYFMLVLLPPGSWFE